jgi:adenine phosphoribosyltransferase
MMIHRTANIINNGDLTLTMDIKSKIRTIPHFPKEGIMFRDVTTLLKDPAGFRYVIDHLVQRYAGKEIDKVVGVESRGFILGGALAHQLNVGFVPVRKQGKLPGEKEGVDYQLEYGTDRLEIHKDAIEPSENILIVDDLIATGGTAKATIALIEKLQGKVVECAFIVELPALQGVEKLLPVSSYSMVKFDGH